jgi:hypothetical protein
MSMLTFPSRLTTTDHPDDKVALDVFCDWLEATVLFQRAAHVATPDIVDSLVDDEIVATQTEAWRVKTDGWSELRRRERCLGDAFPFEISDMRLTRKMPWRECLPYSFCLVLSLASWYPEWANSFGHNYNEQGELFEVLTERSLRRVLSDWTIERTGWSRTAPNRLQAVVGRVSELLNEPIGNVERWTRPRAKDAGLDILCFRGFPDERGAIPLYLVQCASGRDWENKLDTPKIQIWRRVVQFTALPTRAFATPYSFIDRHFPIYANIVDGLFLDRYRLLQPMREGDAWLPGTILTRIRRWLTPRIAALPWS